jgi:hypothetical protein
LRDLGFQRIQPLEHAISLVRIVHEYAQVLHLPREHPEARFHVGLRALLFL